MKPLTRPGWKFVASLPRGEKCVGMVVFKGKVIVATDRRVMKLVGNKLKTILFEC